MKNIKSLRKTNNAMLLVASSDSSTAEALRNEFANDFKEVFVALTGEEAISIIKSKKLEMCILDTNISDMNYKNICFELNAKSPTIPKIMISEDINDAGLIAAVNCGSYTMIQKPISLLKVRLDIVMCLNQTKRGDKMVFSEGIYFDEYREQFFKKDGTLIELTKLELGMLKFLIDRKGEIIDYSLIQSVVWKGKNMSVFTMRNVVNKIRQKIYYDIIQNYSNKGYSIDTPKNI